MANDEVTEFLHRAQDLVSPAGTPPPDGEQPTVPFPSTMKLTREQEKKLIEHAFKRYKELEGELGRDVTLNPQWWSQSNSMGQGQAITSGDTFLGKRTRYDATFLNDNSWRPYCFPTPNIFQDSNLSIPLVRRICRQMIARAKNEFFDADPWFNVDPMPVAEFDPVDDAGRADRIEKFCRYKLDESKSKDSLGRAISRALILGEAAVKTSYVVRDQLFNSEARVLSTVDGQPVLDANGNHITEDDKFVDAQDGTGKQVLAKDGMTEAQEAPIWMNVPLTRRQVLFEGARSEVIFYKDFLCPLTATDVQSTDCVIHLYDKPVMEFIDLVVKRGMIGDDTEERLGAAQKIVALVKKLTDNTPTPKAAVNQNIRPGDNYDTEPSVMTGSPVATFAEFYLWYDANSDGVAENILLIADRKTQAPLYYETMPNVTVDGLRPIEIVRVNPVEGRWYGQGIMEIFQSYQDILDIQYNRWNYNQSASGRVILWSPHNTVEGDQNPHLNMQFGQSYQKKPGMKAEDIVEVVYLSDTKFEQIHLMLQHASQLLMNESGVSNANDEQAAGLQTSELATGVMQVAKSGDELFRPLITDLHGSLEAILSREIGIVLANLNPEELFTFLEGDVLGLDTLTPEDVRGLRFKTKIALSKSKDGQQLQSLAQAIALIDAYYALDPIRQERLTPYYRRQLRILDPQSNADEVIAPLPMAPPVGMEGGAAPAGGASEPGQGTPFPAQLGQQKTQAKGVSAPGGTIAG